VKHLFLKVGTSRGYGAEVWRVVSDGLERTYENPVITFSIKRRMNTELFIDRTAALFVGESRIRM